MGQSATINQSRTIICFGEALWDALPGGERPGGAPMNVAYHLHRLGHRAIPVTAVGLDATGDSLIRRYESWGLETGTIWRHPRLPTGRVVVEVNEAGVPGFEIERPAAWEEIELTPDAQAAIRDADAVVFGSLAQHGGHNRDTFEHMLDIASGALTILDVNLRSPYWELKAIMELVRRAHVVKLNHEELVLLADGGSIEERARKLASECETSIIAVTLGSKGAAILYKEEWTVMPAVRSDIVDTVGAGDAFLAALIDALLWNNFEAEKALRQGVRLAAYVVAHAGATPPYDPADVIS